MYKIIFKKRKEKKRIIMDIFSNAFDNNVSVEDEDGGKKYVKYYSLNINHWKKYLFIVKKKWEKRRMYIL